ncbi:MAG: DUF411 domain-containing protein [Phaeospirillum sp.]|nr:DUF411 domain-containing protein [Phaeospirillum sp.]
MQPFIRSLMTAIIIALASPGFAAEKQITVWKSPSCGCCTGWTTYLQRHGYQVKSIDIDDLDPIKKGLGVPESMQSCHTARIDGYVIEGHVPVEAIDRLLTERPKVTGIASPGMPQGSPGMNGPKEENVVQSFGPGGGAVFGRY